MEIIYFNVINWLIFFFLLLKTWESIDHANHNCDVFLLSKGYQNCRNALAGVVEGPCYVFLLKHIASFISTSSIHFHGGVSSP